MMENFPVNILFADTDLIIRYANPESIKTLKKLEQSLPIKSDEIVGSCIDIFHQNPEYQRKILADPNNMPHEAKINIGSEVALLRLNAIRNKDGEYIGPMLTWDIVTEQEQAKARE